MTSEKILSIVEKDSDSGYGLGGFIITTNKQEIKLFMSQYQQCCEHYGYFFCNEDPQEFVGANILDITLTDKELNTKFLIEHDANMSSFSGELMFVNIETSNGTLQFVAYNEHNGYYSHEVVIESTQLQVSEYL